MSKTREALEAAREFVAGYRRMIGAWRADSDDLLVGVNALLAQIDAALAEQQAIAAQYIDNEHLQRAVAEARAKALDDAAKVCESTDTYGDYVGGWLETIAERIRALQDQAPLQPAIATERSGLQPAEPTEAQIEVVAKHLCHRTSAQSGLSVNKLWGDYADSFKLEARTILRAVLAAKE